MGRLLLVRHCQAVLLEDQARPLTDLGQKQAEALAAWLKRSWPVDRIISSPYRRAIDTIAPFAAIAALEITLDDRLREREAPFLLAPADHMAAVEACFADHALRHEGAETGFEAQERGWDVIEVALQSVHTLPVLVTHGQLLSFTLARTDGTTGLERWQRMTMPDVFLLESVQEGGYRVERVWAG